MAGELQSMRDVQSEVSEDGSTWRASATIGAYGVYDPEKQPTTEEVIAMKAEFNRGDILDNAAPKVCTRIVLDMLTTTDTTDTFFDEDRAIDTGTVDEEGATVYFNGYDNAYDMAEHVGYLAGHWTQGLARACGLPGTEWPAGMSPPATFAEILKEVKAEEIVKWADTFVNKWGSSGDHYGKFTVDETTQLEVETKDPEASPLYLCRAGLIRILEQDRYEQEQYTVYPDKSVMRLDRAGQLVEGELVPDESDISLSEWPADLKELIGIVNTFAETYNDEVNAGRL